MTGNDGMQGRTAVVAGAAGGMGFAIARALLDAGATVTLVDLEEPGESLDKENGRARGDVSDPDFVAGTVSGAFEASGRLDYLVNAAGVLWFGVDSKGKRGHVGSVTDPG